MIKTFTLFLCASTTALAIDKFNTSFEGLIERDLQRHQISAPLAQDNRPPSERYALKAPLPSSGLVLRNELSAQEEMFRQEQVSLQQMHRQEQAHLEQMRQEEMFRQEQVRLQQMHLQEQARLEQMRQEEMFRQEQVRLQQMHRQEQARLEQIRQEEMFRQEQVRLQQMHLQEQAHLKQIPQEEMYRHVEKAQHDLKQLNIRRQKEEIQDQKRAQEFETLFLLGHRPEQIASHMGVPHQNTFHRPSQSQQQIVREMPEPHSEILERQRQQEFYQRKIMNQNFSNPQQQLEMQHSLVSSRVTSPRSFHSSDSPIFSRYSPYPARSEVFQSSPVVNVSSITVNVHAQTNVHLQSRPLPSLQNFQVPSVNTMSTPGTSQDFTSDKIISSQLPVPPMVKSAPLPLRPAKPITLISTVTKFSDDKGKARKWTDTLHNTHTTNQKEAEQEVVWFSETKSFANKQVNRWIDETGKFTKK